VLPWWRQSRSSAPATGASKSLRLAVPESPGKPDVVDARRDDRRDTMTTATVNAAETAVVEVSALADGVVVRLAGAFGTGEANLLRGALLRPRPAACRDILIDAGAVTDVDDAALAVLIAAPVWAEATGGTLNYTRMSEPLRATAGELGILRMMPMLPAPGERA
jgi:anti-anti-sigma regulatory factor